MKQILSAVFFISIIFFSCQKEPNDPSPPGDNPAVDIYVAANEVNTA
jgi:hypothetical protein